MSSKLTILERHATRIRDLRLLAQFSRRGPGGNPPLGTTNTLNTGDILVTRLQRHSELHGGEQWHRPRERPEFAVGVSMTGIATANITNFDRRHCSQRYGGLRWRHHRPDHTNSHGWQQSLGVVQVGLPNLGLNTALETLNINSVLIRFNSATRTILDSGFVNVSIKFRRVRWR